jgi:hypothetical protein
MKRVSLVLVILFTLFSCDRIKRKGNKIITATKETAAETKQKVSDKKDQLIDKVFPSYDSNKPDTKSNRKRFREHLQVEPIDDVKNIYAYGDFLGADYKVLIAFTCEKTTIDKIIAAKKMQLTTTKDDDGLLFLDKFKWWDKDKIEFLEPYKVGKETEYWEYLWYDPTTKQAYYEEYSL